MKNLKTKLNKLRKKNEFADNKNIYNRISKLSGRSGSIFEMTMNSKRSQATKNQSVKGYIPNSYKNLDVKSQKHSRHNSR